MHQVVLLVVGLVGAAYFSCVLAGNEDHFNVVQMIEVKGEVREQEGGERGRGRRGKRMNELID